MPTHFPLQSLPSGLCGHVIDYLPGPEVCELIKLDPNRIGACVSLQHVISAGDSIDGGSWDRLLHIIHRSGRDFHVPSNQRLLRIITILTNPQRDTHVLCDLCQRQQTGFFVWYWGMFFCNVCFNFEAQHYEFEIEHFPDIHHPSPSMRCTGPRKYFVRWAGEELQNKLKPLAATRRLAKHGGCMGDFVTECVLEEPVFDPYTGEACGPLISHRDIHAMDDCESQEEIDALVASLDAKIDQGRVQEVASLKDCLEPVMERNTALERIESVSSLESL